MEPSNQSIFKRHKVDYTPDEPIVQLAAGHNQVAIATKDKNISIIDIVSGKQTDCDLSRYLGNRISQAKLHKMFVDPTGKFSFISLAYAADGQPMENLLFVKRIQPIHKLKNHLISAIAWYYPRADSNESENNSTGTILLGTTKGLVLQAELIHGDESKFFPLSAGSKQYVREVFDVGPELGSITGLEYHQIPSNSPSERSFIIFVSTNNRLYRLIGNVPASVDPPPLHQIFAQNSNNYRDVPGRFSTSKLDFFYPAYNSPPVRYGWLTEPGVITGELQNQFAVDRSAFESEAEMTIIPYENPEDLAFPLSSSTTSGMSPSFCFASPFDRPISMIVTNFHVMVLFRHSIKALCILNNAVVYEEYFSNRYGNIQGMCKDPVKNTILVYCERAIFRFKMLNENRNVWRIFLEQKRFDLAKKYSTNDEFNYDRVICGEAQHYFSMEKFDASAELFAKSKKPFEDIALMFMEIRCVKALRKYLLIKLDQFDSTQPIQLTMTLAWLLELIISKMSVIKTKLEPGESSEELEELFDELEQLFSNSRIIDCFSQHSNLFYGIVRNYSDQETFIWLAKLIGDFERVVEYYMEMNELGKALEIMKAIKNNQLFYKYGHILMKKMPKELVDALIEQPSIEPSRLVPVLIQENPYFNKCFETIRYLEHCIKTLGSNSRVIYNHLFELYARHRDEETLIEFLESQVSPDGSKQCRLDIQLSLRLCTELKLDKACVALYSSMGLYDEALDLAIRFDIELAKQIANRAESEEHQKRLWLTISEKVLTANSDIQIATRLLKECRLLKIEDILPFFPDYSTIDFFKNAIRQSLEEYKNQIMTLKDGTYEKIADDIRAEIKTFRNRYSVIKVGQKCEICRGNLLSQAFYVFPCGHLFHNDCIVKEIITVDPYYQGIEDKLRQLALESKHITQTRQQSFLVNSVSSQTKSQPENIEKLENELNKIISSECLYCGSFLPTYIDKPPLLNTGLDDCL